TISRRRHIEADAREVEVQHAYGWILAAQDDRVLVDREELARDRVAAVVVGGDDDLLAGPPPAGIAAPSRDWRRARVVRDRQRFFGVERCEGAVAESAHAVMPGLGGGATLDQIGLVDVAAQEPQGMIEREIGDVGCSAGEIGAAIGEGVLDPAQMRAELRADRRLLRLHAVGVEKAARELDAVGLELGWKLIGISPEYDADGIGEEDAVGPGGDELAAAGAMQARLGKAAFDLAQDEAGVAIDVGADLHHR